MTGPSSDTSPTPAPAVCVSELSFRYAGGPPTLREISFVLQPGERVGLVGPSGAGKSTLLMHLNGLLPRTHATGTGTVSVSIHGQPVNRDTLPSVRQQVGFLFQDPDDQLFCPTVAEDVAFGPLNLGLSKEEVHERVRVSLEQVGLAGFERRSTMRLSDGERKRVGLAGVLACQPSILVLDEPTSNLDPRARRSLISHLDAYAGTQLIATHDLDFVVLHCSRVLILDAGEIHADGPTHRVLRNAALMEQHGLEVPLRLAIGP
ncbi:energy-coupling factor ABC transporter ATP-binding protein [Thalassoroseus pseudoceratinae]|uniref:energy-coupling factor ABC transporter ATP-binding protein n=1 Tax=Thalassoroseus pseudoceratinae TaxID=2713176 RepID=UPI00141E8F05|nr:energy-coupling factor ABC transporter ATP-binding protein [Thalassoroseus pseudoceratinae]